MIYDESFLNWQTKRHEYLPQDWNIMVKTKDEIMEELRTIKDTLASSSGNDLEKLIERMNAIAAEKKGWVRLFARQRDLLDRRRFVL